MTIADEIEKWDALRRSGAISEEEYERAKSSLLKKHEKPWNLSADANTWGMLIHFSQFLGYIMPVVGMIVPVLLWQLKKNESEIIDKHGKIVINWILTELILLVAFGILCIVFVGIPLLLALAIAGIIFPIVGGIKANDGVTWPYPFSIRFFRLE